MRKGCIEILIYKLGLMVTAIQACAFPVSTVPAAAMAHWLQAFHKTPCTGWLRPGYSRTAGSSARISAYDPG